MRTAFATVLAALAATGAAAGPSLSLKVSGPASVHDVDNLDVTATVVNTGDVELKLLNDPRGVLSTFKANTFGISKNGASPKFTGAKVKYNPNAVIQAGKAESFTTLSPGQSITVTHNLAGTYNFTTSGTGSYTFSAANTFFYVDPETNVARKLEASVSDVATLGLSGQLSSTKGLPQSSGSLSKRASFVSCSSSRQSSINTALPVATSYISNSLSYLNGISSGTTRYTTWFGSYTASRKSTVQSHFSNLNTNSPTAYTYDCSCTEDYYAYVYPDDFGYVYLCNAFWSAPTSGTDSKAGTIVHEASHFTRNGGTDDYAYGQTAAKSLASSNPSQAVFNADSHEYFAENTPALS